ncbi:MAG: biotin transporter BioY [Gemmatimonadetes bacterium]|nr:biotin transporter BioY [Gemmatimonadota bacterium]
MIFALGAAWLSVVSELHSGALFAAAVAPFLLGAVIKIGIGVGIARLILGRSART